MKKLTKPQERALEIIRTKKVTGKSEMRGLLSESFLVERGDNLNQWTANCLIDKDLCRIDWDHKDTLDAPVTYTGEMPEEAGIHTRRLQATFDCRISTIQWAMEEEANKRSEKILDLMYFAYEEVEEIAHRHLKVYRTKISGNAQHIMTLIGTIAGAGEDFLFEIKPLSINGQHNAKLTSDITGKGKIGDCVFFMPLGKKQ